MTHRFLPHVLLVILVWSLVSEGAYGQQSAPRSRVRDTVETELVTIQLPPDLAASLDSLLKAAAVALRTQKVVPIEPRSGWVARGLLKIFEGIGALFALITAGLGILTTLEARKKGTNAVLAVLAAVLGVFLVLGAAIFVSALILPLAALLLSLAAWGFLLLEVDKYLYLRPPKAATKAGSWG